MNIAMYNDEIEALELMKVELEANTEEESKIKGADHSNVVGIFSCQKSYSSFVVDEVQNFRTLGSRE